MALSDDEVSLINRLAQRHDAEIPELEAYDSYYEGTQPLAYMHPEILAEVKDRIRPVVIFWPQMVVDSVEERLRVEGFKTGDKELDRELGRVWAANDMQIGMRMATVDALVMRRSYISVGANEDDPETPLVCPESPLELYVENDPRTRKGRYGLRRTTEVDPSGSVMARYGTLYTPDATIWCRGDNGGWREDPDLGRDTHKLGALPIAQLVNRGRTRSSVRSARNYTVERIGRSDLEAVMPLSDAANKLATDMMVAAEFVAIPLRGLFGDGVGPDIFTDEKGSPMSPLQAVLGRLLTIPYKDVRAFEWAAAQLANFTGAIDMMAKTVASVTGLPPHYLGMSSDNPASAEAIAGSESRLATRAERKQDALGSGVRQVARLIRRFQTGDWDKKVDAVKTDWRNVRTPTIASMADAAVKLFTTTPPIIPLRQTREALGKEPEEIDAMEEEDEKAAERQPGAQLAAAMADNNARMMADGNAGRPTA